VLLALLVLLVSVSGGHAAGVQRTTLPAPKCRHSLRVLLAGGVTVRHRQQVRDGSFD
jgi:hypothetical protein